jgi:hypothetical protein
MTRRKFLGLIAAIPFAGFVAKLVKPRPYKISNEDLIALQKCTLGKNSCTGITSSEVKAKLFPTFRGVPITWNDRLS